MTSKANKQYVKFDTKLENCWLCEAWVECRFQIDLVSIMKKKFDLDVAMVDDLDRHYLVYMHFDFDRYDADKMDDMRVASLDLKGQFKCSRMVPQGYYHYFFSYREREISPEDARPATPVFTNYTFVDDAADIVEVMYFDQREIQQHLLKPNRCGFEIDDAVIEQMNQVNTLEIMNNYLEAERAEDGT